MRLLAILLLVSACSRSQAPAQAPGASSTPAPSHPARVTIVVSSSPPGTLVMESSTHRILGRAPGEVEIERSIDPIKLEFLNPDYIPEHRVVTPTQDVALSVPMRPIPRRPGPPPPPEKR
jgi:hypothetical protein